MKLERGATVIEMIVSDVHTQGYLLLIYSVCNGIEMLANIQVTFMGVVYFKINKKSKFHYLD